ncbi:MAG: hypothetical protein RKE49_00455 [Oceanicaulis sp.]
MAATPDTAPRRSAPRGGLGRFSPPDWAFMPGAALVFAGLVAVAMIYEPAGEDPVVTQTEYVMAGPALAQLVPGPGTGFQLITTGGTPLARLTATASLEAAGAMSAGIAAVMPAEFEARLPGRLVKVEARLRAGPEAGIEEARIAYFSTGGGAASGWRTVRVSETFETVGFCYTVDPEAPLNEMEIVGLWPDIRGASRSLLLQELRVTIQPGEVSQDECERSIGL